MTIQATEPTATETNETVGMVLEVPLMVAIRSAAAMLTCISKDAVTEVLTVAFFSGTELFATDRYKVARFPMPIAPGNDNERLTLGEPFLIPSDALTWVSKLTLRSLEYGRGPALTVVDRGYTVRYERDAAATVVTASVVNMFGVVERSEAFEGMTGNYPPLQRLFDRSPALDTDPQMFDPAFLGPVLAYCAKHGGKTVPVGVTMYAPTRAGGAPAMLVEGAGASFLIVGHDKR